MLRMGLSRCPGLLRTQAVRYEGLVRMPHSVMQGGSLGVLPTERHRKLIISDELEVRSAVPRRPNA